MSHSARGIAREGEIMGKGQVDWNDHIVSTPKDYLSPYNDMNHYRGKLLLVEVHRVRVRE